MPPVLIIHDQIGLLRSKNDTFIKVVGLVLFQEQNG